MQHLWSVGFHPGSHAGGQDKGNSRRSHHIFFHRHKVQGSRLKVQDSGGYGHSPRDRVSGNARKEKRGWVLRRAKKTLPFEGKGFHERGIGGDLLSHQASLAVPSALRGLTSVCGMGTGVTLSLWPPKFCRGHATAKNSDN